MREVAAGVILRADGRALVCQRAGGFHHAHLWEFPGGKLEAEEDAFAALRRELLEELSLPVTQLRLIRETETEGLRFLFLAGETSGHPVAREHEAVCFLPPRSLLSLHFCPADAPVARAIALNAPRLRNFVWDFDGTLADTYAGFLPSLQGICARYGLSHSGEELLAMLKRTLMETLQQLAGEAGVPLQDVVDAFDRDMECKDMREVPPIEGVVEALRAMPGRHFLYTHNRLDRVLPFLEAQGLTEVFERLITHEDRFPRKPAPDALCHLLAAARLNPLETVMIGDRAIDMEAGYAAGVLTCLLDVDHYYEGAACDVYTDRPGELPGLLLPEALL